MLWVSEVVVLWRLGKGWHLQATVFVAKRLNPFGRFDTKYERDGHIEDVPSGPAGSSSSLHQ